MISTKQIMENKRLRQREREIESISRILESSESIETIAIVLFSEIDMKHDGVIDLLELKMFFKKSKLCKEMKLSDSFIEDAFKVIDFDDSKTIDINKMKEFIKSMFQNQLDKLKAQVKSA